MTRSRIRDRQTSKAGISAWSGGSRGFLVAQPGCQFGIQAQKLPAGAIGMFGRIAGKLPRLGRKRRPLRELLAVGAGRVKNILQALVIDNARVGACQPDAAPQVRQATGGELASNSRSRARRSRT